MKLSEQIKNCLDGSGCKDCESYEAKSVLTCRGLLQVAYERIKGYEELEEQGFLLKLPCKVGDTVYEICEGFIEPCTVEVIFLADYKDKDGNYSYMMEIHYDREDCPWVSAEVYFTDIGKTVFLTKSDAESALQKMNEMEGKE